MTDTIFTALTLAAWLLALAAITDPYWPNHHAATGQAALQRLIGEAR